MCIVCVLITFIGGRIIFVNLSLDVSFTHILKNQGCPSWNGTVLCWRGHPVAGGMNGKTYPTLHRVYLGFIRSHFLPWRLVILPPLKAQGKWRRDSFAHCAIRICSPSTNSRTTMRRSTPETTVMLGGNSRVSALPVISVIIVPMLEWIDPEFSKMVNSPQNSSVERSLD